MRKINSFIDHTLLKPAATAADISRWCEEAVEHGFAAVCVNPCYIPLAGALLQGTPVKACAVVGFPLGANTAVIKAAEARQAIRDGAGEVDMVMNIGAMTAGDTGTVAEDIAGVVKEAAGKALVKVIMECCLLTDEQKEAACRIAVQQGADYVKTSTGFSTGGATVSDVALMHRVAGGRAGVKASGGIRDYATAIKMIEAGATRIGTSSGVLIVKG